MGGNGGFEYDGLQPHGWVEDQYQGGDAATIDFETPAESFYDSSTALDDGYASSGILPEDVATHNVEVAAHAEEVPPSENPARRLPHIALSDLRPAPGFLGSRKTAAFASVAAVLLGAGAAAIASGEDNASPQPPAEQSTPSAGQKTVPAVPQDRAVLKLAEARLYGDWDVIDNEGCLDGTDYPKESINAPNRLRLASEGERFTVTSTDKNKPDLHFEVVEGEPVDDVVPTDDYTAQYTEKRDC